MVSRSTIVFNLNVTPAKVNPIPMTEVKYMIIGAGIAHEDSIKSDKFSNPQTVTLVTTVTKPGTYTVKAFFYAKLLDVTNAPLYSYNMNMYFDRDANGVWTYKGLAPGDNPGYGFGRGFTVTASQDKSKPITVSPVELAISINSASSIPSYPNTTISGSISVPNHVRYIITGLGYTSYGESDTNNFSLKVPTTLKKGNYTLDLILYKNVHNAPPFCYKGSIVVSFDGTKYTATTFNTDPYAQGLSVEYDLPSLTFTVSETP